MRVIANGDVFDAEPEASIASFILARGLDPRSVIVERNGEPVPRAAYDVTVLSEGDRLELVRAVAGG